MSQTHLPSSFRDPSGFMFANDQGELFRQVNAVYAEDYDHLMASGLYGELVQAGLLVAHQETDQPSPAPNSCHKILKPERIPFVSYPYEWSFGQLKDAALATLDIQTRAMQKGMVLKDASAFNIQFADGRPVFIDTLSFQRREPGAPWVAYRQFCQHFLAPLLLMAKVDVRLNRLLAVHIDGVPLDMASAMLPRSTKFNLAVLTHIHMHAKSQKKYADKGLGTGRAKVSETALLGMLDSLAGAVRKLDWRPAGTEWVDYYDDTNYSESGFEEKKRIVRACVEDVSPGTVWDMGANTGEFSKIAAESGAQTVAFDVDYGAVEAHYRRVRKEKAERLLPLVLDLTCPSPDIGWALAERDGIVRRGKADLVLALALVHHLAISNNVPFPLIARFFQSVAKHLVIEFVPKTDSQVQRMLSTREDVFDTYDQEHFLAAFEECFEVVKTLPVTGSERTVYLMRARAAGQ